MPCIALIECTVSVDWQGRYDYVGALLSWFTTSVVAAWICEARLQPALLSLYKSHMAGSRREIAAN